MKSNIHSAAIWLWSLRGKDIWLTPGVLTAENKDPTSPNLTSVEAVSLFDNLLKKGLIIPDVQNGQHVFRLHESKIPEWRAFIESVKEPEHEENKLVPGQDDVAEQCVQSSTGNKHANHEGEQPSSRIAIAIFGALELFALVFWILAADVFHGDEVWVVHSIFLSLAGCLFVLGGAHLLVSEFKHRVLIWGCSTVVCLVLTAVFIFNSRPHPALPKPHLSLFMNTLDSPRVGLMFTNGFLFMNETAGPTTPVGWVIIHVPEGHTNVDVKFGLMNDSPLLFKNVDDSTCTVDEWWVDMHLWRSKEAKGEVELIPDPAWKRVHLGDEPGEHLWFPKTRSLLPGDTANTMPITFNIKSYFASTAGPVMVKIFVRGKGIPLTTLYFRIATGSPSCSSSRWSPRACR